MSKKDNTTKLEAMRSGGKVLATILSEVKKATKPGVKTRELDELAKRLCLKYHVKPSFLNYDGFPASICISINDQVVHGIPGEYIIMDGDIVSLDFGVYYEGYHTDSAITFGVGNISAEAHRLMKTTEESLLRGIKAIRPGLHIGVIGATIEKYVEAHEFGVVRALVGHAIGENLHEDPYIPNFGRPNDGPVIKPGMTLAIEPMVTLGSHEVFVDKDDWTYKTSDGSLSAHFEHTVWVHEDSVEILTKV